MQPQPTNIKQRRLSLVCPWLKRIGVAGFLFFLAKGLLWLLVPSLLAYLGYAD